MVTNIIDRILERYQHNKQGATKTGMARGFLIVDENVAFLEKPLEEANFHVATPDKGWDDTKIKKRLLGKRIIITKNTQDFLDDAPVYDYGIIGLEALPFIDPTPTYTKNETAKLISKAYGDFELHFEKTGFVLMLKPDGKHTFKRLG